VSYLLYHDAVLPIVMGVHAYGASTVRAQDSRRQALPTDSKLFT
jgi:hypothetical protein